MTVGSAPACSRERKDGLSCLNQCPLLKPSASVVTVIKFLVSPESHCHHACPRQGLHSLAELKIHLPLPLKKEGFLHYDWMVVIRAGSWVSLCLSLSGRWAGKRGEAFL